MKRRTASWRLSADAASTEEAATRRKNDAFRRVVETKVASLNAFKKGLKDNEGSDKVAADAPKPIETEAQAAVTEAPETIDLTHFNDKDAFITDETWHALATKYDEKQLLDLVFTVGRKVDAGFTAD